MPEKKKCCWKIDSSKGVILMLVINFKKCTVCGKCIETCPFGAMEIKENKVEIISSLLKLRNKEVNGHFVNAEGFYEKYK